MNYWFEKPKATLRGWIADRLLDFECWVYKTKRRYGIARGKKADDSGFEKLKPPVLKRKDLTNERV